MAEKEKRTKFEYTYTYDRFTVFFYGGRVFVGKKMHEPSFPILKIGNRMVVPKEKFIQWVEQNTSGGDNR